MNRFMIATLATLTTAGVFIQTTPRAQKDQSSVAYALIDLLQSPNIETFAPKYEQLTSEFNFVEKTATVALCITKISDVHCKKTKELEEAQETSTRMKRGMEIAFGLPATVGGISFLFGICGITSPAWDTDWKETIYYSAGLPIAAVLFYLCKINYDTMWGTPARLKHELHQLELIRDYLRVQAFTSSSTGDGNTSRR